MAVAKVQRRGRAMWRARVKIGGRLRTAYRDTKAEAARAEAEMLAPPDDTTGATTAPAEVPTLAAFAVEYMNATTNNKPSTIDSKRSILEHHLLPALGVRRIDAIGPREIEALKASELASGLSKKTVNNILTVLRNILDVAAEWRVIATTPRVKWLRTDRQRFRFLDFDEADRLVTATGGDDLGHAMIVLAMNTGLRLGEILALRWDAVDLKAGRLHVREAAARGIVGTPKSGRAREVPLNDTAIAMLRSHKHLRGPLVFCTDGGGMLTKGEAKAPLRRAQRRAGIVALGWHDLRHTFASHLVMRGVSIKAVQELLGHATIEMTMRYAHLAPTVTRDAVRTLDRDPRGVTSGVTTATRT
jgi:integrase